ncbi:3-oxoacyl-reductase [Durotheca rogersii]|uniref:3-oxoacyl-reductase n=1 Tax=Durotheca rogersii TaxID=419775 RepID=UPI00221F48D7|nr:3-oxoacyl-reductase [Durotheca rogersii]KAI5860807.1 3-oxoacyl-reductase [Durotheca rogersii]
MSPTGLLRGKTAIITGGTTGIGRAIALEYLRQGCNVVVNHLGLARDAGHLASLEREAGALAEAAAAAGDVGVLDHLAGDVSDPATGPALVRHAVARFGRLDVCVSNAGICEFAEFLTLGGDLWARTVRTNLDGAFYVVQAAAQQMAAQAPAPAAEGGGRGAIIGVSSISALVGGGRQAHYTPTKAGVLSLMQSCAVALGPHAIRCNALLPGTVRTQLNDADLADPAKRAYMEGRIPLGRTGDPRDLAGPAVFLASDYLSGYVTGAQLLVDGGLFVNLQ